VLSFGSKIHKKHVQTCGIFQNFLWTLGVIPWTPAQRGGDRGEGDRLMEREKEEGRGDKRNGMGKRSGVGGEDFQLKEGGTCFPASGGIVGTASA